MSHPGRRGRARASRSCYAAGAATELTPLELDAPVWPVALSPDGRFLAAGDHNGAVKVWEVARLLRGEGRARAGGSRPGPADGTAGAVRARCVEFVILRLQSARKQRDQEDDLTHGRADGWSGRHQPIGDGLTDQPSTASIVGWSS